MSKPDFIEIKKDLKKLNTWQVGGQAEFFCQPDSIDKIRAAYLWATNQKISITILGGGSNVLISDKGIPGLVICLKSFNKLNFSISDNQKNLQEFASKEQPLSGTSRQTLSIEAEAGVGKNELLKLFLKHQLAPAVFLAGIPGQVGGGVVMNAGVGESIHPKEFSELIQSVDVLKPDGSIVSLPKTKLDFNYRHCNGWQPGIIVKAYLAWDYHQDVQVLEKVKKANSVRLQKQPLDWPSCGSVFVNPQGHKAAALIQQTGLKGTKIGQAQVSEKHANFIINLGGATASDMSDLIQFVQSKVKSETGIELKTEVVRLGRFN